jgi:hypothetical protein
MTDFTADDLLDLGHGIRVRAVDVSGVCAGARRVGAGGPARDAEPDIAAEGLESAGADARAAAELGRAIAAAGLRVEAEVHVPALITAAEAASGPGHRGAEAPRLEIGVDAPPADEEQVLLEVDGTGHVRWHFPAPPGGAVGATRAGGRQRFVVPVDQFAVSASGDEAVAEGLLGFGVRKVLQVLRFPIQTTTGWVASKAVGAWENQFRPHRLSFVGPDGTLTGAADPTRIAQRADGPFLTLVHGTFSRGTPTFARLFSDADLFRALHERYAGRVLVFDHPSVHVAPAANATWLRTQLPSDRDVDLHVLAHSRGGLVARHLPADHVRVGTLVHVAVPNAGTTLASRDKLGDLLDTYTNLLSLFPDPAGTPALEVVLEVVKQVAQGALGGLDGLAAMDPGSPALSDLNRTAAAPTTRVLAVAADYEPRPSAALAARALDRIVDALLGTGNDLVVPTDGVARAGRYTASEVHLAGDAGSITHNTFFADAAVRRRLAGWLTA